MSMISRFTLQIIIRSPMILPHIFLIVILPFYIHLKTEAKSIAVNTRRKTPDILTGDEYEYQFDDIIPNPIGRTQIISKRWPRGGMVMFYSSFTFDAEEICYLRRAAQVIAQYSCIPIYLFELNDRCANELDALGCVIFDSPDDAGLRTYEAMKQSGASINYYEYEGYVVISKDKPGCTSYLGRLGERQELTLNSGCFSGAGPAIHEMIHALGYKHEFTRTDRDKYVTINTTNIKSGKEHNFRKVNPKLYKDFGPYNYLSIMHYPGVSFAKNRNYPTIIPKEKNSRMGQKFYLTIGDKVKIRSVTHCPGNTYEEHVLAIKNLATQSFQYDTDITAEHCTNVKPPSVVPPTDQGGLVTTILFPEIFF